MRTAPVLAVLALVLSGFSPLAVNAQQQPLTMPPPPVIAVPSAPPPAGAIDGVNNDAPPVTPAVVPATAVPAPPPPAPLTQPTLVDAAQISAGDTAWMLSSTALVLLMTIPGLALFYTGMVRKKNALATMAHSFVTTC